MSDLNSLTGKAENYRNALGRYVGLSIVLDCSEYRMVDDKENGRTLLVLEKPCVIKVDGRAETKPWIIGHLWVVIPERNVHKMYRYQEVARKIRVEGIVHEYTYKETGLTQVGVYANKVDILKYDKEVAKMFNLRPGQRLTPNQYREFRIQKNRERNRQERKKEQEELRRIAIAACLNKDKDDK